MNTEAKQVKEEPINPDLDLILRCQQNDDAAFGELIELYRSRVASISYQVIGNYEDARDVSQEIFIKLFKGIHGFDPNKKFFTWLYRLTVNASIDFLRSKKRRSLEHSIDERPDQYNNMPGSDVNVITKNFERGELRQILIEAAGELNQKQQIAFTLCDLQNFTADEVAEVLDCPKVTLRWYLHEARKRVRMSIAKNYPEYFRGKRK